MDYNLTVVKLGGSVVTDKSKPFHIRRAAINRVAKEIAASKLSALVLVHGGGSFGHPLAKKYDLANGLNRKEQLVGFSKTRDAMMRLNEIVIKTFISQEVPVVSVQPSAFIRTNNGRIIHPNFSVLEHLLRLGFIPVLHGDAVMDISRGFTILSGDQITAKIAEHFAASRLVLATDVDGLFSDDPKRNRDAKLLEKITIPQLRDFLSEIQQPSSVVDVTGAMFGKIGELIHVAERSARTFIVNALKPGRLQRVLSGKTVKATEILPSFQD